MNIPLPGLPVRGSKTGKPIMALLDLLGRTWALGVVWQLQYKPLPFRELQRKCDGISPSLLTTRLKELCAAGLVERTIEGYKLSELGDSLFSLIAPLSQWSQDWANSVTKAEKNSQGSRGKKDD